MNTERKNIFLKKILINLIGAIAIFCLNYFTDSTFVQSIKATIIFIVIMVVSDMFFNRKKK